MAGSSEPAFLFLGTKRELVLHRLSIYFATAPLLNEKYNIFTQVVGGRAPSDPSMTERMMLMSTYEEFMIILTTVSLIVTILNMKNKK